MRRAIAILLVTAVLLLVASQITIFVVQPIGALPEGRTLIILRLNTMNFVDSPDAWCARTMGGVSLLCRGATMARVVNQTTIFARLPYSRTLYRISTGGAEYVNSPGPAD